MSKVFKRKDAKSDISIKDKNIAFQIDKEEKEKKEPPKKNEKKLLINEARNILDNYISNKCQHM